MSKPKKTPQRIEADALRAEGFKFQTIDVTDRPGRPRFDPLSDAPIMATLRDKNQFSLDVASLIGDADEPTKKFMARAGHLSGTKADEFKAHLSAWVRDRLTAGLVVPDSVEWQQGPPKAHG